MVNYYELYYLFLFILCYHYPIGTLPVEPTKFSTPFLRPSWIEIDLGIVRSNVMHLKNYIGQEVNLMAVVKANAYGYGMFEMAETAISSGATWLGVATLDEALAIRSKLSSSIPILVLGYTAPEDLHLASRFNITVTAISLQWIKATVMLAKQPIQFHLKLDTGLNRLGVKTTEDIEIIMNIISNNTHLSCTGIFTHFATSEDVRNTTYFQLQLGRFQEFLHVIPDRRKKLIHCANSGATLYHMTKPFFDMVRLGKAIAGPPNEPLRHLLPVPLEHSLSLHSTLDLVKCLNPGEQVGYLGEYSPNQTQWIGTVPIGYGDGWHQQFKTSQVLVDSKRVPIVGRISMDQLVVALPQYYPEGTRVTFIGRQGNEIITGDEIAARANQPRSEVYSSLTERLPRVYKQNGKIIRVRNSLLESFSI